MRTNLLAIFVMALSALWAAGCDSSVGDVPTDTIDDASVSCGKSDNSSDVCTAPADAYEVADSATNDASDDTAPSGDSVSPPEDTVETCQFQAGDECPGLQNCLLQPRTDGQWDCGSYTVQTNFVCQACFR